MKRDIVTLKPTMRQIAEAYAVRHGVTLDDLKGRDNTVFMSAVRRGAMLAIHQTTKHSLSQIGRFFGGRDHTTVMYAIRRAKGESSVTARSARALAQQEKAA